MKVLAINGSPHAKGNTYTSLKFAAEALEQEGIEAEILHVGHKAVHGCIACGACFRNRDEECIFKDDYVNELVQKMKEADGLLLGSPVYYSGISGTMKSLLDRAFYVGSANGGLFRHKVGASVAAVRRSGGVFTFDSLNHYLLISEMVVPSSNYWNVVHGTVEGEAEQDLEGVQCMKVLGQNMAWLMKLIESGKDTVKEPERVKKTAMNFIH